MGPGEYCHIGTLVTSADGEVRHQTIRHKGDSAIRDGQAGWSSG